VSQELRHADGDQLRPVAPAPEAPVAEPALALVGADAPRTARRRGAVALAA
jgi:hypothetical protein